MQIAEYQICNCDIPYSHETLYCLKSITIFHFSLDEKKQYWQINPKHHKMLRQLLLMPLA